MKKLAAVLMAFTLLAGGLLPTSAPAAAGYAEEALAEESPEAELPEEPAMEEGLVEALAEEPAVEETPAEDPPVEESPVEETTTEAPSVEEIPKETPPEEPSREDNPEEGTGEPTPETPLTPASPEPTEPQTGDASLISLDGLTEEALLALEGPAEDVSYVDGGEATAYILTESGEQYGEPEALIRQLLESGGGTLYLLRRVTFTVSDLSDEALSLLAFSCASENDQVVYEREGGDCCFQVESMDEPEEDDGDPEERDPDENDNGEAPSVSGTDFAQPQEEVQALLTQMLTGPAELQPSDEAPEEPEDAPEEEALQISLAVTPPEGFAQDAWFDEAVTFTLSGKPEGDGYQYAVSDQGGQPVCLDGDRFTVSGDGAYALSFFIMETATDTVLAQSDDTYFFEVYTGDLSVGVMAMSLTVEEDPIMLLGAPMQASVTSTLLSVTPSGDFADGSWVNQAPVFALSASPALAAGEEFAVIVDNATVHLGSQASYTAPEGQHALKFLILDGSGAQVDVSAVYNAWVDTVAPVIDAVAVESSSLYVTASDALSGLYAISIDGGRSWSLETRLNSQTTWTSSIRSPDGIQAGQIIIRDKAGNRAANPNRILINADSAGESATASVTISSGGGGGGMGGASASRAVAHAKSDDRSTTAYNAVDLDNVESFAMTSLSVGDEALDLQLYGSSGDAALFTAGLAHWDGENGVSQTAASGDGTADTLVLSAVDTGDNAQDYRWQLSGQVIKKLADSGVSYLVLQVGENVTTLSTSGFTGGLRYDLFRAEGTPSKAFSYSIAMSPTPSAMSMTLQVEGERYAVSGDKSGELYYYNVFSGSPDLLREAFGAVAARNQG